MDNSKYSYDIAFENVTLYSEEHGTSGKIDKLDLKIERGGRVYIFGQNDSTRTLLLFSIIGIIPPKFGNIKIFGKDLPFDNKKKMFDLRHRIGYAYTQGGLLKNLTIKENILLPLEYHNIYSEDEIHSRYAKIIEYFKISHTNREAWNLNRTEEKKILLARAVALEPEILLIDDPTIYIEKSDIDEIKELVDVIIPEKFCKPECTILVASEERSWALEKGKSVLALKSDESYFFGDPADFFLDEIKK